MGYPMALNLRSKLEGNYELLINDVSEDAITSFQLQTQGQGPVRRVDNGFQAAQQAVSISSNGSKAFTNS